MAASTRFHKDERVQVDSCGRVDTSHIRVKGAKGYQSANVLSRLFWLWLDPMFWAGVRKKELEQKDLPDPPDYALSEKLQHTFQKHWQHELDRRQRGKTPRLWVAIVKLFWVKLSAQFIICALELALQILLAIMVGWLADYFVSNRTPEETRDAYLYAVGITTIFLVLGLNHAWAFLWAYEHGMIARIAATGAIFKKVLELNLTTIGQVSIGKIVNLAGYDVQRLDKAFAFVIYFILTPVYVVVVTLVLWFYIGLGPSSLAGMGAVLMKFPILYFFGKLYAKLRHRSAQYTDRRVKVMNQVISGIRVIKMYGWEYAFKELVVGIRRKETRLNMAAIMFQASRPALFFVFVGVVNLLMFSTYVLTTGNPLTPAIVFTTISLMSSARIITIFIGLHTIVGFQEAKVALSRIQELLLKDLPDPSRARRYSRRPSINETPVANGNCTVKAGSVVRSIVKSEVGGCPGKDGSRDRPQVVVEGLSAAWEKGENGGKLTLENISFSCDQSARMLAIVGPVGAGKSTILHCLLGELQPLQGSVDIVGSLGYAAQDPWVFSGTVRENILFGREFDDDWYQQVVDACCLNEDFKQLPYGEATPVGERGVTLSGGQKARVTLARAIYRRADVYLLDDPLSAVDTVVGRRLFETCLKGVLSSSVVVLVTHQLQYAQLADTMLVVDQGTCLACGTYSEIMEMVERSDEDPKCAALKNILSEMVSSDTTEANKDIFDVEDSLEDSVLAESKEHTITGGVVVNGVSNNFSYQETVTEVSDGVVFRPSSLSSDLPGLKSKLGTHHSHESKEEPADPAGVMPQEDKAHGSVSLKTYCLYFIAGGGYVLLLFLLVVFLLAEASTVVSDWYLSEWAEANQTCDRQNSSNLLCGLTAHRIVQIYSGLVGAASILSVARSVLFFYVCVNAAKILHNRMFGAVLRAPIRFFDTNPIGRVLNRFSKDVGILDDIMPPPFFDYVSIMTRFFAVLILAGIANWYTFIPVAVVIAAFLFVRWYFLKAGREMKRLEAIARSPLYSHFSTTLLGLTTVRACEMEPASLAFFHAYQDEQTRGWSVYLMGSRWLAVRIDFIIGMFIAILTLSAIPLANTVDAGLIGLSLSYTISLASILQQGVRDAAEVESLMISAERLVAYGNLQPEASLETPPGVQKPPKSWPSQGGIHLLGMKFRYAPDTPYVLKDVTVDIQPKEKIGVVGRTGAGKSSLMQALFRMAEPEGVVEVDGVPITALGLHDVRQKISIIPQDPVLFSGSVRYNLDPFRKHSDEEIWIALEQVQMKTAIQDLEGQLEASVSEGGSNFSVGQRQLMCLARALLRKNRILVIDEATANVDMTTDAIIQQTIRREFVDCTTLTIAHRLNTIMDSDRIMVLSAGRIREFDVPHSLLLNDHGLLARMVEQTGPAESLRLRRIAAETYNERLHPYTTLLETTV